MFVQDSKRQDGFRAEIAPRAFVQGVVKGHYVEFHFIWIMRQDGHSDLLQLLIGFNAWSIARLGNGSTKVHLESDLDPPAIDESPIRPHFITRLMTVDYLTQLWRNRLVHVHES